jgi:hypothetical protein
MRKMIASVSLSAVLCMLSGCAWFSGDVNPGAELAAIARPPVSCIPVPQGFTLDPERSVTFDSGATKRIDHLYTGSAPDVATVRFYKRAMAARGWSLISEAFSLGDQNLRFKKPGQACRVRITPGTWLHPTKLNVQLWTTDTINRPANSTTKTGQ